jgi:phage FluMu gp28-like protein
VGLTKDQVMAKLRAMTPQQQEDAELALTLEEVRRAKEDLVYYLRYMVNTQDEHDVDNPIKRLPMEHPYMDDLAHLFLDEPLLMVEKSRQMMVTWLMVACHLWDAQFHEGRRIFFQSKKEKDANYLIDRAKFIYQHYPEPYKTVIHNLYPAKEPMSYLKLEFSKTMSVIEGTPQGPSVLRQYTASRVFMDEAAFMEQAEEAYMAMKPTITGGGSVVMVSTPNFKNFFYLMAKDELL